jgi:hypothetical protein
LNRNLAQDGVDELFEMGGVAPSGGLLDSKADCGVGGSAQQKQLGGGGKQDRCDAPLACG